MKAWRKSMVQLSVKAHWLNGRMLYNPKPYSRYWVMGKAGFGPPAMDKKAESSSKLVLNPFCTTLKKCAAGKLNVPV